MWLNPDYQIDDPDLLREVMRRQPLATVITRAGEKASFANHLPLLCEPAETGFGELIGHMSVHNPQVEHLAAGCEVLAVFHGPHAYIAPSMGRHPLIVPTWNYVAVHAYGRARLIADPEEKIAIVSRLSAAMEEENLTPWQMDRLPLTYVQKLALQIVGFRISVTRVESQFKLNQDRALAERESVVAHLTAAKDTPAQEIAAWMQRLAMNKKPTT